MTNKFADKSEIAMDQYLIGMKGKAEDLLKEFFVGKRFPEEPWSEEHFEVTMQVIVDTTIANTNVVDFNINTSIEEHILLMNVQDDQENTIADVLYFITCDKDGYTIDDVQVAFKLGAFVAPKEEEDVPSDALPF